MINKSEALKNFGWVTLGFAASCTLFSPVFNGKSLVDLGVDLGAEQDKNDSLPCVETYGRGLTPPFDVLVCK